jgi:hypothetical protein
LRPVVVDGYLRSVGSEQRTRITGRGRVLAAAVLAIGLLAIVPSVSSAAKLRGKFIGFPTDLVRPGDGADWNQPDGQSDGLFRIKVSASGKHEISSVDLQSVPEGSQWNTTPDGAWALGVTKVHQSTLLNAADTTISRSFKDAIRLDVHAATDGSIVPGSKFNVTVTFSGHGSAEKTITLPTG